jgi:hypothetical protein
MTGNANGDHEGLTQSGLAVATALAQRHPQTEKRMAAKNLQDSGGVEIEQGETKRAAGR